MNSLSPAVSGAMTRSVEHGARAVLHVATARALGQRGAFYDDTFGAFTQCGRAPAACGRVTPSWLPAAATDQQAAAALYTSTNALVAAAQQAAETGSAEEAEAVLEEPEAAAAEEETAAAAGEAETEAAAGESGR